MDIGIEISLYPLDADYIPHIQDFIARLNAHRGLRIVTNSMSTQVFGPYDAVFDALRREIRPSFERGPKAVFAMKVLGPFADA